MGVLQTVWNHVREYLLFIVIVVCLTPLAGPRGEALWQGLMTAPLWRGDTHAAVLVVGSLANCVLYWVCAGLLSLVDLGVCGRWIRERKLQPKVSISVADTWRVVKVVLQNQVVSFVFSAFMIYVVFPWRGVQELAPFPSLGVTLRDLVVFILAEEVVFYHAHRLLHHPLFYKRFHKLHHDFTAPFGWAATYSSVLEQVANLVAVFSGPTLMGSHALLLHLWSCFAIINTINGHSGYDLFFMPCPRQHDWHHERWSENFGFLGVLDTWYGTNTRFLHSEKKRQAAAA